MTVLPVPRLTPNQTPASLPSCLFLPLRVTLYDLFTWSPGYFFYLLPRLPNFSSSAEALVLLSTIQGLKSVVCPSLWAGGTAGQLCGDVPTVSRSNFLPERDRGMATRTMKLPQIEHEGWFHNRERATETHADSYTNLVSLFVWSGANALKHWLSVNQSQHRFPHVPKQSVPINWSHPN